MKEHQSFVIKRQSTFYLRICPIRIVAVSERMITAAGGHAQTWKQIHLYLKAFKYFLNSICILRLGNKVFVLRYSPKVFEMYKYRYFQILFSDDTMQKSCTMKAIWALDSMLKITSGLAGHRNPIKDCNYIN